MPRLVAESDTRLGQLSTARIQVSPTSRRQGCCVDKLLSFTESPKPLVVAISELQNRAEGLDTAHSQSITTTITPFRKKEKLDVSEFLQSSFLVLPRRTTSLVFDKCSGCPFQATTASQSRRQWPIVVRGCQNSPPASDVCPI